MGLSNKEIIDDICWMKTTAVGFELVCKYGSTGLRRVKDGSNVEGMLLVLKPHASDELKGRFYGMGPVFTRPSNRRALVGNRKVHTMVYRWEDDVVAKYEELK